MRRKRISRENFSRLPDELLPRKRLKSKFPYDDPFTENLLEQQVRGFGVMGRTKSPPKPDYRPIENRAFGLVP